MPEYNDLNEQVHLGREDDYTGVNEDVAEEARRTRQELERQYGLSVDEPDLFPEGLGDSDDY